MHHIRRCWTVLTCFRALQGDADPGRNQRIPGKPHPGAGFAPKIPTPVHHSLSLTEGHGRSKLSVKHSCWSSFASFLPLAFSSAALKGLRQNHTGIRVTITAKITCAKSQHLGRICAFAGSPEREQPPTPHYDGFRRTQQFAVAVDATALQCEGRSGSRRPIKAEAKPSGGRNSSARRRS